MPPKGHALLSASSSDRWLHCPPSARLCETYEDKGSDYAAEGTDAHALCEYKLRKALGMEATDPTKSLDWYNAEMEDCATGYASFIMELLEDANPILTRSEVYSGIYGRASISFYAFNSSGNKGIACGLNNLQKIHDGEPLGGKASAESDFATDNDDDFLD